MSGVYSKDPQDVDFFWRSFATWLGDIEGDVIDTAAWTLAESPLGDDDATPLVIDSELVDTDDTRAVVWLSGGTSGVRYQATVHVVTQAGREKDETITIRVAEA